MASLRRGLPQSFMIPKSTLTEKTLPDQEGKVFIVTGGNIGVGYNVISILYSKNAKVYMGARSKEKAEAAISSIKAKHPDARGQIIHLPLDLADLTTIKSSADKFLAQETRLDWLCNNAGVMFPPNGSKSAQGYELQLATNVLGPFLFTKLLMPILKKTAETALKGSVRVSWAASLGMELTRPGGVQFEGDGIVPKDYGGGRDAYGTSKTANFFLAYECGKRYGNGDGVLHNAFNPGNLTSGLQRHSRAQFGMLSAAVVKLIDIFILYPAHYGAYTELYCGFSPDFKFETDQGSYVIPWGRIDTKNVRKDLLENMGPGKGSEKLWMWCEQETHRYMV